MTSAARGRPPSPRGVLSFQSTEWSSPEALLLDTSVVVEAVLPAQPGHEACAELFRRLAASSCTVVFNRLLETEMYEALFNLALKERHGNSWPRARYDGRARRRAGRLLDAGRRVWSEMLESLSWSCVELAEVVEEVPRLMRSYGLRSYDAVHAASLHAAGVSEMATLDHGFAALPQSAFTLHTVDTRVATMRRRRATRDQPTKRGTRD